MSIDETLTQLLEYSGQHSHNSSCYECHQFAEEVYNQGREDGIKECHEYYGQVPGVKEPTPDRPVITVPEE